MPGDATKKPWQQIDLLDEMDEEHDPHVDFIVVSARGCVRRCGPQHGYI